MSAGTASVTDEIQPVVDPGQSPFQRDGLLARGAPFAVIAILAEASLALPPGVQSGGAFVASLVLLCAVPVAVLWPWSRLPAWAAVLVPLIYTVSVLALSLAAGPNSGVGIVILMPLVWTALFHRPWESACVVAAVIVVEVIVSVAQGSSAGVTLRRVLLWGLLGGVISVATHGLRDRIQRSIAQARLLDAQLRALTVVRDRDRIAASMQDQVIGRLFAAGITLHGAAAMTDQPEVSRRIAGSVAELDEATRLLRNAIFGLADQQRPAAGLRQRALEMCAAAEPPLEVRFSGQPDRVLSVQAEDEVVATLRQALMLVGPDQAVSEVGIAADDGQPLVMTLTCHAITSPTSELEAELAPLRQTALRSGASFALDAATGAARLAWHFPPG